MKSRWGTTRLEAFSDGVFAIAITLLVLDIEVPSNEYDHLLRGILHEWPSYLGYVTSFVTIGGIWMLHHGVFRRLRYADQHVMRVNLLLLMAVSFLPYPTRLMAETIRNEGAERAAVIFYGTTLLVISVLFAVLARVVARDPSLLRDEFDDTELRRLVSATTPNIAFYGVTMGLALLLPRVAAVGYLVIAVVEVLRVRGDETVAPAAASS